MFAPEEVREKLGLGDLPAEFVPSNNIAPGSNIPVIINPVNRAVQMFRWGLIPGWAKDPKIGYKMFNARAETIAEKPSFRVPFQQRRCLIPADGFYEWKVEDGKKYPYLFTLKDKTMFTFAGLWETWLSKEGEVVNSCTIITTEPNSLVAQYHDRMPVIFTGNDSWQWLEDRPQNELKAMLVPCAVEIMEKPQWLERI